MSELKMWKQWKDKVKKMFQNDETETIDTEHPIRYQRQEIKPKITYQYPEKKSFRFPIIPDEPVRGYSDNSKTPAYLRREKDKQDNDRAPAYLQSEKEKQRNGHTKLENVPAQNHSRKVYKKENAPPFQLTEVPSPVYGLQKQKERIENVPAFKRKEEEKLAREPHIQSIEVSPKLERVDEGEQINQGNRIEKLTKEESLNQQISKLETTKDDNLNKNKENPIETRKEEVRDIKTIQQIVKDETKNPALSHKHTNSKDVNNKIPLAKRKKNKQQENVNPFNVMMTPMDKQLQVQKQNINPSSNINAKKPLEQVRPTNEEEVTEEQGGLQIPLHLLDDPVPVNNENDIWIAEQQHLLEQTLQHFNVAANVVKATQGPSVTRFEVQPEMGVKVSKIRNLSDDLKLNMSAKDIRIEAPIPGKNTVGIEVPNPKAETVGLQEILDSDPFINNKSPLAIALGLNIEGNPKITNIQKMPHGLIAGATGSGKSVCINTILISILYKASHEDVKFLLIDPKMVELAPYNGIPHLVAPVITDVKAATQSLKWAVNEMEERYERFVKEGVRDIERYNRKVINEGRRQDKMPYIVIVIDELADLMMMSPHDVENAISRIAQKSRACGMHLLLATQRPSVDVITGLIKANIPTRIAFSVSSQVDSRTILDASGADKLLGKGDMLFMENGTGKSVRLQGAFVSDDEIERITAFAREIAEPNYLFEQEQLLEQIHADEDEDELLEEVIQFILNQQSASTSMLQRHFKIGYNRAARLIDTLEARGIITGQNGSKPRDVLVTETIVE